MTPTGRTAVATSDASWDEIVSQQLSAAHTRTVHDRSRHDGDQRAAGMISALMAS